MCEQPTELDEDGVELDGFHELPGVVKLIYVVGAWVLLPIDLVKRALHRRRSEKPRA